MPRSKYLVLNAMRSEPVDLGGSEGPGAPRLSIGQVAEIVGVSAARIRRWEQEGLILPDRAPSGRRLFNADHIRALENVRTLLDTQEFTAAGVRQVLKGKIPQKRSEDTRPIGDRIRRLRQGKGISLRKLAGQIELSPSALSALERGLTTPSVGALHGVAKALGTTVPSLLGLPAPTDTLVVRPHDRRPMPMETAGVSMENLYATSTVLQSMLVTIQPGAGTDDSYDHAGEEFLYVLTGQVDFTLDNLTTHRLHAGDAMTFDSQRPHRYLNNGSVPTTIVWVNTPPTF
jgi:DNA-binding transcriptional MerR regulator/quercetin dioxygenase-like cupin family protein